MPCVPIVIPSLEPDERLPVLLAELYSEGLGPVVLLDDGSGPSYRHYFEEAEKKYGCIVLRHAINLGKGRALKDAFNYCLNRWPDMDGCVTADSDGQHTPQCIAKCVEALRQNPDALILGVRDFDSDNVPAKSRMGNKITRMICRLLCGVSVTDTQTGLRAIPSDFMRCLMATEGERFEFETRMLIETKGNCPIVEIPIETVYDSKDNHSTHFDPIKDSARIYKIFAGALGRVCLLRVAPFVIDLALFSIFLGWLQAKIQFAGYAVAATVLARAFSGLYVYVTGHIFRKNNKQNTDPKARGREVVPHLFLGVVRMFCSAVIVTAALYLLPGAQALPVKIAVELFLLFVVHIAQKGRLSKIEK